MYSNRLRPTTSMFLTIPDIDRVAGSIFFSYRSYVARIPERGGVEDKAAAPSHEQFSEPTKTSPAHLHLLFFL